MCQCLALFRSVGESDNSLDVVMMEKHIGSPVCWASSRGTDVVSDVVHVAIDYVSWSW